MEGENPQQHILPMTILSVDYRCADLLRWIIADKIISSEPSKQDDYLTDLELIEKVKETKAAKEAESKQAKSEEKADGKKVKTNDKMARVGETSEQQKELMDENPVRNAEVRKNPDSKNKRKEKLLAEYRAEYRSLEQEELLLANIQNLEKLVTFAMKLCKKKDNHFESPIDGSNDFDEKDFGSLCGKLGLETLRDGMVKRLKHSKTSILAKIMQTKETFISKLFKTIKGEHPTKENPYIPDIKLRFCDKSSDLIKKINSDFKRGNDKLAAEILDESQLKQYAGLDYFPTEEVDKDSDPYTWLDEILKYRNELIHPPADEIALKELYEKNESISRLSHPYVKFLHYVNFEKYFPFHSLEKKVRDFLYPIASAAEMELVLNNYKKLLDKLDDRRQRIEHLLAQITSLKESKDTLTEEVTELQKRNDTLSKIEKDRKELIDDYNRLREKHRSKGAEILQILEDMKPDQPESVRNCKEKLTMVAEGMMDVDEAQQADDGDDQPA